MKLIEPEELVGGEWAEWYAMTPQERWAESMKLWEHYLAIGGSLDPDPDPQSPFFDEDEWLAEREESGPGSSPVCIVGRDAIWATP